jgi:MFS family permease
MSWGWRIPFLLSAVLVGIGLYIRLRLSESPIFSQSQQNRPEEEKLPILTVLRKYPKNILLVMGARFAENGCAYLFLVFVVAYATTQVGFSTTTILAAVAAGAAVEMLTLPAFGALSDKVGRRPVYIAGAVFLMFFAFPFFWLIQSGQTVLVYVAMMLALGIGHSAMFGPQSALFAEMFGTRVRYTGLAVGHGLASVFAGGLSPLIATALLQWTGGDPWPVAVYIIILGLITTVSIYLAQETRLVDLAHDDGTESQR